MDRTSIVATDDARSKHARGGFDTTHWSLVVRGAKVETVEGQAALEELCRIYWYPLFCFARRHVGSREDAEDLTQGFFAWLLEHHAIAQADNTRGHFRTFLLYSFQSYCTHDRVRAGAQKRGGGHEIVSLEALQAAGERLGEEPASTETAERIFDRKWAVRLIEQALASVRAEYAKLGKAESFDALKTVVWGDGRGGSYPEIAARVGSTPGAVKVAVFRLRQRLGQEIRAEVAKTVVEPSAIEEEMQYLIRALGV
jgi:RNA polymerase sigma-70 factor (ECF subfamily)